MIFEIGLFLSKKNLKKIQEIYTKSNLILPISDAILTILCGFALGVMVVCQQMTFIHCTILMVTEKSIGKNNNSHHGNFENV